MGQINEHSDSDSDSDSGHSDSASDSDSDHSAVWLIFYQRVEPLQSQSHSSARAQPTNIVYPARSAALGRSLVKSLARKIPGEISRDLYL